MFGITLFLLHVFLSNAIHIKLPSTVRACLSPIHSAFRLQRSNAAAAIAAASLVVGVNLDAALAVSGGGFDYANKDLREEDFTGRNEKAKDFTQAIATGVKFKVLKRP